MLKDNNNEKDSKHDLNLTIKDIPSPIFYSRSNKLVTGLYMVTDIINIDEPLRNKLRTLGVEIVSGAHTSPIQITSKINEIVSFLEISSALNLISQMNCDVLKKEFVNLKLSIQETDRTKTLWFEGFLDNSSGDVENQIEDQSLLDDQKSFIGHKNLLRTQQISTTVGVQKGSTLMKALAEKTSSLLKKSTISNKVSIYNFDILKQKRREEIIRILRTSNKNGYTITDIKNKSKGLFVPVEALLSCSEKTLQRELISMVKDHVLYKTGEKRWSKYFISESLLSV